MAAARWLDPSPSKGARRVTCKHGKDPMPDPIDFKGDELRIYLGLPDTAQGRSIAAAIAPGERAVYASMRAVELELQKGRIPIGVIACDRERRSSDGE